MKDLIYYYDKTTFQKNELGEIQTGFNQSFVADGTKDSSKIEVLSFNGTTIEPNTIIFHRATQTWWIVADDKVARYEYEISPLYLHTLKLQGAIELLNARDLIDNGFNSNRYNVDQFIKRLFSLSNFEYPITIDYRDNITYNKNVDYVKTFENYTLLSALREFLDGYNCSAKLEFIESSNVLVGAKLTIVSKTGNASSTIINGNDIFLDPRETKNISKSNYGTSVISNAENVVSTKAKTYPSVGGVKLSSNTNIINGETALLRLPSNTFRVNYIDMFDNEAYLGVIAYGGSGNHRIKYDSSDPNSRQKAIEQMYDYLMTNPFSQSSPQVIAEDFINNVKEYDLTKINRRFYYCDNYDPTYDNGKGRFISNYPINIIDKDRIGTNKNIPIVLTNSELQPTLSQPKYMGIYFKRGQNIIENFNLFDYDVSDHKQAYLHYKENELLVYQRITAPYLYFYLDSVSVGAGGEINVTTGHIFNIRSTSFSVNYIPMSDLKIKLDNNGDTIDSVLYNQNGKLNDSNALSKVLLSYSKEIESDTITRFGTFYGKYNSNGFVSNLPSVGDIIYINQDYYVINNISLDFQPNENINDNEMGYYITAEVSMSKKVATKSMLTSPNTNIRDYGIPQNNNVKRKQLYRDFFELDYTSSGNSDWYQPLSNILDLSTQPNQYKEHIAIINTHYENSINGSHDYYYQLETTTYFMKKSIYEIVDFKDNNIIGYGFQNVWSGFDISKIFISGNNDNYNTPISYVDNNGEVMGINIKFTRIEDVQDSYNSYTSGTAYEGLSIYNASVFIPSDIYTYLTNGKYDFLIEEDNYYKDALEVPVFEYSAQIDDTDNVVVGSNIFDNFEDDTCYAYAYVLANKGYYDDNNYELANIPNFILENETCTYSNAVKLEYNEDNELLISLYDSASVNIITGVVTWGNEIPLNTLDLENKDLIIVKHTISVDDIPDYYNVLFQFSQGIETIYYSINNGLTFKPLINNFQISVLNGNNVYWYAESSFGYELDNDVPSSEQTAQQVVVTQNTTIAPTASPITYQLNGTSENGTVLWYPNQAYVVGTEITSADYLDVVYYKIVANTGYDAPQNNMGSLVVNNNDFNIVGTNANHTFDPCTIKTFTLIFQVGNGATLYYSLNNGLSFIPLISGTSINVEYGQRVWWYATIDNNSHYELGNNVPNGYANAQLVIVTTNNRTLNASTTPKTYTLLPSSVSNGTIDWYPEAGAQIYSATYGDKVYYQLNANSGYHIGSDQNTTYVLNSLTLNNNDFTYDEVNNTATATTLPSININTYQVTINKGTGVLRIRYKYTGGSGWKWAYDNVSLTLSHGVSFDWYAELEPDYEPSSGTPTSESTAETLTITSNVTRTASGTMPSNIAVTCSGTGTKNASVRVNTTSAYSRTITRVVVHYGLNLQRVIFSGSQTIGAYSSYTFTGTTTINLENGDYAVVTLSGGQTEYGYF